MIARRALEPLRYGPRRREFAYMALALILALWWSVGGDRPEDRILPMGTRPAASLSRGYDAVGSKPESTVPSLCPKLRDGLFLRWQIEHRRETGFNWHRCAYGPVWLEAARQEGM